MADTVDIENHKFWSMGKWQQVWEESKFLQKEKKKTKNLYQKLKKGFPWPP